MIEMPLLVAMLGCVALVYMGLTHTRLSHRAAFMADAAAHEQMQGEQYRELISKLGEACEAMSAAMLQGNFDEILDREDIDAYQLLGKFSLDLDTLARSCYTVAECEMIEIAYEDYEEDTEDS